MRMKNGVMIKAFTLAEVMVTLAITSLVVIIAYMGLEMVQNYYQRTSHRNNLYAERLNFRSMLAGDLDRCDSATYSERGLRLFFEEDTVHWAVDEQQILRKGAIERSFGVGSCRLKAGGNKRFPLIDEVEVIWPAGAEDSLAFHFYKVYPLETEVNRPWQFH